LIVLAVVLWTVAAVNACTPTRYLRSGQLKGTDFVHFYTLGSLAARGDAGRFWDFSEIDTLQASLVPEAANLIHPPVYGPQVSLALSPLGYLSYEGALLAWTALSAIVYLSLILLAAKAMASLRPHLGTVLIGALAFPPFWQLLQHGQLSIVALTGIVGGWYALTRDREILAGACLGLLAYKPSLFAPVLLILTATRSWRIAAGAIGVGVGQVTTAVPWVGTQGLSDYAALLVSLPGSATLLAANPAQMHSLRTFWGLLLPWPNVALVFYGLSTTGVIAMVAFSWTRTTDWSLRLAMLSTATVLMAPHLYVYDLVILGPTLIWLIDWFITRAQHPHIARLVYASYLAPLAAPFVPLIRVQLSTLCLCALLMAIAQWPGLKTAAEPSGRALRA
jgi:hypothetical protein